MKIEITNTKQAEKLIANQKRTFGELLSCKMDEMAISPEKLAEQVSWNKQNKDDIDPRNISYYKRGRKPKKKGRIEALAEALGIPHYELLPDHALANGEADELPDKRLLLDGVHRRIKRKVTEAIGGTGKNALHVLSGTAIDSSRSH